MTDDLSADQILRIQAMQMAVAYVTKTEHENILTPLANKIYRFIRGEMK
jgi:hypothetical protein